MNKKTMNKFDPFMPIKMENILDTKSGETEIASSNFDEFLGDISNFTMVSDKIKIDTPRIKKGFVILITKKAIGSEEILGKKLLEDFIFSISESIDLPQTIIFMNEAIYLPEDRCIYDCILKMKKYGVGFFSSLESIGYFKYDKKIKGITQATSADITEKVIYSQQLISL